MSSAGYSNTPLGKKLGISPSMKLMLINPPEHYADWLGTDISTQMARHKETPDLIHLFAADKKAFRASMRKIKPMIKKNRALVIWVSWYKKSSGIPTDILEDDIRHYALQNDLVDVKVCAVTETWSGLKLVVPMAKRH
ncbi:MAG: DUF3052 domain-containing protein [Terrimonas sp.]|nr:DUF3052 domain-containing protein [Terrimonas sp.]